MYLASEGEVKMIEFIGCWVVPPLLLLSLLTFMGVMAYSLFLRERIITLLYKKLKKEK
jgi:hypothetical protein